MSQPKRALITGITGQDGAWLAQRLLKDGWRVAGAVRQSSRPPERLIKLGIHAQIEPILLEMSEASNLIHALRAFQPDAIFHLAAPSFVGASFKQPVYTFDTIATGTARLLDAVQVACPEARFYHASTSEMFGTSGMAGILHESSPFAPQSPYAIAKCAAHKLVALTRESTGMFAVNGILFNHESTLRGPEFVTRRISLAVAAITRGAQETVTLGSLDAKRDWGWAPEYVDAMVRLLAHDKPIDVVVATGTCASVRDFATEAFAAAEFDLAWEGSGVQEIGRDKRSGRVLVRVDPAHYRPAEVHVLRGDPSKARIALRWEAKTRWKEIARLMVESDLGAQRP